MRRSDFGLRLLDLLTLAGLMVMAAVLFSWGTSSADTVPPVYAPVRNETPAPGADTGSWNLQRAPTSVGATCYRNGLRQQPGVDYTLLGKTLVSQLWEPSDTLACDYQ